MNVHFSLLVSMDLLFLSVFRGVRRASIYIYDPGSAGPPPSPAMVPATPWCGVVWSGGGLLGVVPLLPPVAWCGFGFSCGGSPAFLGLLLGVWYTHPYDDNDDDGDDDHHHPHRRHH